MFSLQRVGIERLHGVLISWSLIQCCLHFSVELHGSYTEVSSFQRVRIDYIQRHYKLRDLLHNIFLSINSLTCEVLYKFSLHVSA